MNLLELVLINENKVEINFADVGYGLSQVLPYIIQCVISQNNNIVIEEPESHVHPKLQADITDLFADTINQTNKLFLTTHSEYLLLRILRLIRNGKVDPNDVSIYKVENKRGESLFTKIDVNEEGQAINGWPGIFFSDRLREL